MHHKYPFVPITLCCTALALLSGPVAAQPDLLSRLLTYDGAGVQTISAEEVYTGVSAGFNYSNPQKNMVRFGALYYHAFTALEGDYDVYLRTSTDGLSWGEAVQVSDDVPGDSLQSAPNLVVYADGPNTMVVVSWVDRRESSVQLRTATSSDGGVTFAPSVQVSSHPDATSLTGNLAVDGAGTLYAAWSRFDGGCISGAWFTRSDDNGASWSAMVQIFSGQCYSGNGHVMAAGPDSVMVVVSDDQFNHTNVIVLRSIDGGTSFTQASVSTYSIAQSITEYTCSAVDPSGRAHIAFTYGETQGTASSLNYASSDDWGLSWTVPVPVSDNNLFPVWSYHSGQVPAIAVAPSTGDVYIAWSAPHPSTDNFEVYLTRSTDDGLTWDTDQVVNLETAPLLQAYVSMALQDLGGGNAYVLVTWRDDRFVVGLPEAPVRPRALVHPSPATDRINVDMAWSTGPVHYEVIDARGAIMLRGAWSGGATQVMDVSRLDAGLHILRLVAADRVVEVPWVKE